MTMELIQRTTVETATTTIDFTSIPQNATDLVLLLSARTTSGTNNVDAIIRFNDVTTGYNYRLLQGTGTATNSQAASDGRIGTVPAINITANTFSSNYIYIANYAGSTNKLYSSDNTMESNGTLSYTETTAGLWSNTSAITKITFVLSASFEVGSSISLYKITKGSIGGITVT
jgi:hypothetical protein